MRVLCAVRKKIGEIKYDRVSRVVAGRAQRQQQFEFRTWGGKRAGAGRPVTRKRRSEPHKKRPRHDGRVPVHVTSRVLPSVGVLRRGHMFRALRAATITVASRENFRIVHFSIQRDHVHLLVEAENKTALAKGMQAFQISAARHINAAITRRTGKRRSGPVFSDRYHARALKTPREVRNALAYVLNNWRHHDEHRARAARAWKIDPYSSGFQFGGWKELEQEHFLFKPDDGYDGLIVWLPRTWLLREGWERHGRIRIDEVPAAREEGGVVGRAASSVQERLRLRAGPAHSTP
jgi:REP element-mobilizing transposase RayT